MGFRERVKSNWVLFGVVTLLGSIVIVMTALVLAGITNETRRQPPIPISTIESTSPDAEKLIVGGDEAYPPFSYLENGIAMGFDNDLIRAAADVMGKQVEFRLGPWTEVKQQLLDGEIDLINGMAYSSDRGLSYDFANPHSVHYSDVFTRRGSNIKNLEDLNSKEVIVQDGDIMHDYLHDIEFTGKIITVPNPEDALKLLSNGKHDAALLNNLIGYYYIERDGIGNLQGLNLQLAERKYGIAVRDGDQQLLQQINQAFAVLDTNGTYEQLNQKWFALYNRQSFLNQARYFVYGLIGLSALFGLVVLWGWSLSRRIRVATQALRKSEQKYSRLVNSATDGIVVLRSNFILYLNPQAKSIFEMEDDIPLPFQYEPLLIKGELASLKEFFLKAGEEATGSVQRSFQIQTLKGNLRWIRLKSVFIEWEGKPSLLGLVSDITESRRMEEAIRESESRYRLLFEKTPVGLFSYDYELRISNFNDRLLQIFKISPNRLENLNLKGLADLRIMPALGSVFENKDGFYDGAFFPADTGLDSELFIRLHTTPVLDEDGQVKGGIGLMEDMTGEVRSANKLLSLETRFSKAFLTSPDSININRFHDGLYLDVNDGFLKLTGYQRQDVLGKTSLELNIWADAQDRQKLVRGLQEDGMVKDMEALFRKKDGSVVIGSMSASLLEIDGELCIISITRDISDRKTAEQALRDSETRYRSIFESVPVSIWEEDFLGVYDALEQLREEGVEDLRKYMDEHPEFVTRVVKTIKIRDVNNATLDIYEADSKEELMVSLDKIFVPESYENFKNVILAIWQRNRFFKGETVNHTLDGKRFSVSLQASFPEQREEFSSVLVSIADITKSKTAELALRESESRYRSIFNSVPVSIWEEDFSNAMRFLEELHDHGVKDLELHLRQNPALLMEAVSLVKVIEVNDVTVPMYEASNKQELLHSLSQVFTEDAFENFLREIMAFWNKKPIYSSETTNRTLTGKEFPVLLSTGLPPDIKDFSRVLVSVEDITERKKSEQKIRKQVENLAALRAVDLAISASMELHHTLRVLVNQANQQLGVDATSILLFNPETGMLHYATGSGFRTLAIENTHLKLGESYAGRAAQERRIVAANDLDSHHSQLMTMDFNDEHFTDYIGVPLVAKGEIKGVLELFNRSPLPADTEWMGFLEAMASQAAIAIDNSTLFSEVQKANLNLKKAYDETIEGWAHALELRDGDTEWHSLRVAELAVSLGGLVGLDEDSLVNLRRGALLHDIGKMGIPDEILLKADKLTDQEWEIMRKHPVYSHDLLSSIEFLEKAIEIPYTHHEKWDGSGYPQGLKGEEIPLTGRIFAVVDCWDALRSDRPYRKAISDQETWEYIRANAGKFYDPAIVDKFAQLMGFPL